MWGLADKHRHHAAENTYICRSGTGTDEEWDRAYKWKISDLFSALGQHNEEELSYNG